jgi:hypothetical protein
MKIKDIPPRLLQLSIAEIEALETKSQDRWGLLKQEVNFIMKHKPSFILHDNVEG